MSLFALEAPERLLLAALALPLAVLFVARRRPQVMPSAYAFLWARLTASGRHRRSRRYQDVLRWAWQLGLLGLLALAAAGPVVPGRTGPLRQVIVLDDSASMGARTASGDTRLALGAARAAEWLRPGTLTTVVAGGPWPRALVRDASPALAASALRAVTAREAALDVGDLAAAVAGEHASDVGAVVVVTDACGEAGARFAASPPAGAAWIAPGRGEAPANCALTDPYLMSRLDVRGWRVVLRVANHGPRTATRAVGVVGSRMPPIPVIVEPGEVLPIALDLEPGTVGRAVIALDPGDALAADDRIPLAIPPLPRAVVTLVSERRVGGELLTNGFWSLALEALGDWVDRDASRQASSIPSTPPVVADDRVAITILDDVRLRGPLPPGLYLMFGVHGGGPARAGDPKASLGAWHVDHASPFMRSVELSDLQCRGFSFRGDRDQVLAASAHGPLVVAGARGGARYLAFGFALADSNLYALAAFPLLLRNAIEELARLDRPLLPPLLSVPGTRDVIAAAPACEWFGLDGQVERLRPGDVAPGPGWLRPAGARAETAVYAVLRAESRLAVPPGPADVDPHPEPIEPEREDLAPIAVAAALAWLLVGLLVPVLWPRDLRVQAGGP